MKADAQLGFSFCNVSSLWKPICRDNKTQILSRIHPPWKHSPVGTHSKVCLTNTQFYYWFNEVDNEVGSSQTLLLKIVLFTWNKSEKEYSVNNLVFSNTWKFKCHHGYPASKSVLEDTWVMKKFCYRLICQPFPLSQGLNWNW